MIKHIFRLMWNRKRKNALLIVEIFAAFVVLFALSTYIIYNYNNYIQPAGFNHENVWAINMDWPSSEKDFVNEKQLQIKETIRNFPEIEKVALSAWATPFDGGGSRTGISTENGYVSIDILNVDEDYVDLFDIKVTQGKNIMASDTINKGRVAMINQYLVDEILGDKNPIGNHDHFFGESSDGTDRGGLDVVGVFTDFKKYGPFQKQRGVMIYLHENVDYFYNTLFVKVKPGSTAELEERLLNTAARIGQNWNIKIDRLEETRDELVSEQMIPIYSYSLIAGFLIVNVALGLFGVLWFNIQQRKSEIGLRRVIGALATQIQQQIVSETIVMTIIGLILGVFLAIQVPLLKLYNVDLIVYLQSIMFSIVFIAFIAIVCSAYPSFLASKIQPALTLHED